MVVEAGAVESLEGVEKSRWTCSGGITGRVFAMHTLAFSLSTQVEISAGPPGTVLSSRLAMSFDQCRVARHWGMRDPVQQSGVRAPSPRGPPASQPLGAGAFPARLVLGFGPRSSSRQSRAARRPGWHWLRRLRNVWSRIRGVEAGRIWHRYLRQRRGIHNVAFADHLVLRQQVGRQRVDFVSCQRPGRVEGHCPIDVVPDCGCIRPRRHQPGRRYLSTALRQRAKNVA